jgi:hypothetical protein
MLRLMYRRVGLLSIVTRRLLPRQPHVTVGTHLPTTQLRLLACLLSTALHTRLILRYLSPPQ